MLDMYGNNFYFVPFSCLTIACWSSIIDFCCCFVSSIRKASQVIKSFHCLCSFVRWFLLSYFLLWLLACKYLLLQTAQEKKKPHKNKITFQQAGYTVFLVLKRYLKEKLWAFCIRKKTQLCISGALLSCLWFCFFFSVFILVVVCWGRSKSAWMALTNLNLTGKNSPRSLEPPRCFKVAAKLFPSGQFPAWSGEAWPCSFPSDCTLRKRDTRKKPAPWLFSVYK